MARIPLSCLEKGEIEWLKRGCRLLAKLHSYPHEYKWIKPSKQLQRDASTKAKIPRTVGEFLTSQMHFKERIYRH